MVKVAQIFLTLPVGGAEDLVISLFRAWESAPVRQVIVCLRSLGPLGNEMIEKGKPVELLSCAPGKRWNPVGIFRLAGWLRRNGIEVVHSHVYNSHLYAVPAARLAGLPVILHHHKTFNHDLRRKNWVVKQLSRWTSLHLCLAETTRTDLINFLKLDPAKVVVLPNGVDPAEFAPVTERAGLKRALGLPVEGKILGNVASLNRAKNQGALLPLMGRLRREIPSLQLVICGEGPLRPALEKAIGEAGLGGVVKLAGNQRPIAPWFRIFDAFVFPSTWEGQPLALLQAMAAGVPIVASRIEGNVAALGAGHPGLVDFLDEPAVVERLKAALEDEKFRREILSFQSSQFAASSLEHYAARLQAIYESLALSQ